MYPSFNFDATATRTDPSTELLGLQLGPFNNFRAGAGVAWEADLWGKFFREDPLAPGAGEALREGMLRHGGAREPGAILRDMLGDGALMTDQVGAAPDPTSMLADLNRGR